MDIDAFDVVMAVDFDKVKERRMTDRRWCMDIDAFDACDVMMVAGFDACDVMIVLMAVTCDGMEE